MSDRQVQSRIEGWKAKLIDLSRANRLLQYRHHRASSVRIVEEDPREVGRLVLAGKKLSFDPRADVPSPATGAGPQRTGDLRLQTDLPRDALDKVLRKLYRDSGASIEEQGFNTLFLALGLLEFRMPGEPDVWRAPLLLLPVQLTRRGARADYVVASYPDEPRVNPALVLKLGKELGMSIAVPELDETVSYDAVRSAFAGAVEGREGWQVADDIHLAPFSFAKIPLYEDLARHGQAIGERPIVRTIATGVPAPDLRLGPLPSAAEVESAPEADRTCRILESDSSQDAALLAAHRGHSFVIQGPPGTGKSQTIANIIADALAAGRTVLFVSEKMAALEVVHRRLARAGLGDFCLELHSHKTNKREVVASLGQAWKRASERAGAVPGSPAELRTVQAYLRSYVEELGKARGKAGLPTHRILGEASRLSAVPAVVLGVARPEDLDGRALSRVHEVLREGARLRSAVQPLAGSPWRGVGRTSRAVSTSEDVRRSLNLCHTAVSRLAEAAASLERACGAPPGRSAASVARAAEIARHVLAAPVVPPAFLVGRAWGGIGPRGQAVVAQGVERGRLRAGLLERYDPSILQVDARAWSARARPGGGPVGWWRRSRLRRDLRARLAPTASRASVDPEGDLRALARVAELTSALEGAASWSETTFRDAWEGVEGDWEDLSAKVEWVRRLFELWPPGPDPGPVTTGAVSSAARDSVRAAADAVDSALKDLEDRWASLVAVLQLDAKARLGTDWREADLPALQSELDRMAAAVDTLPDWIAWQAARAEGVAADLGDYLDDFDGRDLDSRHLLNAWFRAYYRAMADRALEDSPVLGAFQGSLHETRIARYRDLDDKALEANAPRAAASLRAKVPPVSAGSVADSETGVLRRQMELQTRHMATRKLFDRIPTLLRTLKPCLMTSPLSVATYLPPEGERFDLVVFDEASQICTEDAIGALARGRQVVVAGDSKQLPPTAFFESRLAERDEAPEDALVDLKSILEECSAGQLPERPLLWHYRSRDESLISFSNACFYDGALITFPSALRDPDRLGISFVHVADGVYDAGKTRTNPREAEAVAERVFRCLRERPDESIGVVTFSTAQRDAVLDALDARRRADETLEGRFAADADEPVFVKNIESVQGDERDIILFSVGYGRGPDGHFLHNFGPLTMDGGERRLNVAVSRARRQMIVFASVQPEEIDPSRVTRPGARLLREYLERARRGLGAPTARAETDLETVAPLVRAVRERIEAQGFHAEVDLGESGFRIDLAVRHPEHPDRFMLAVLCDVPGPRDSLSTRDREQVRPEVLTRLGWRIHRIWAPDWLRSPDREAGRLRSALEEAARESLETSPREEVARSTTPAHPAPPEPSDPPLEAVPPGALTISGVEAYRPASLPRRGPPEGFHRAPLASVAEDLAEVLRVEAPVHVAVAARRLADAWGLERVTERVTQRVAEALGDLERRGGVWQRDGFVYLSDGPSRSGSPLPPDARPTPRAPGGGVHRPMDQIPPGELGTAVLRVVETFFALSEDALIRETARLYGFQRAGGQIAALLRTVIAEETARGRLVRDASGWIRRR